MLLECCRAPSLLGKSYKCCRKKCVCKCYRAYRCCSAFNVVEVAVALKNCGRCCGAFEVLQACRVFQGAAI